MELKFLKREKVFKKEGSWLTMSFYWKIAVCFVFVAAIVSAVFGYLRFMDINKGFVSTNDSASTQNPSVKKESIDKALEYFRAKEQKTSQILNSSSPVVDPSL